MGHRSEGSQKHETSQDDQNRVWYFIEKCQYDLPGWPCLSLSCSSKPPHPASNPYCLVP
jgi:hypothetical protein